MQTGLALCEWRQWWLLFACPAVATAPPSPMHFQAPPPAGDDVRDDVGGAQAAGLRGVLVQVGVLQQKDRLATARWLVGCVGGLGKQTPNGLKLAAGTPMRSLSALCSQFPCSLRQASIGQGMRTAQGWRRRQPSATSQRQWIGSWPRMRQRGRSVCTAPLLCCSATLSSLPLVCISF